MVETAKHCNDVGARSRIYAVRVSFYSGEKPVLRADALVVMYELAA